MSRARGVLVLAALAVPGIGSSAQELDVQRIAERVEAVRSAYRDATRKAMQFDSLTRQPENLVAVSEGGFHLMVAPEYAEIVRRAARAAADSLDRTVGDARELLPRYEASVQVISRLRPVPSGGLLLLNLISTGEQEFQPVYRVTVLPAEAARVADRPGRWYNSSSGEFGDPDDIESEITDRLLLTSYEALDRLAGYPFRWWVDLSSSRPRAGDFDYRAVYRSVVVSPYWASKRCFAGDNAACRRAFHLDDDTDWHDWYQNDDLLALVRGIRVDVGSLNREVRALYQTCLREVLADCRTFLEAQYADRSIDPPFATPTRSSLLQVAFTLGGAGSYRRLLESNGTVLERLTTTANADLDTLLDTWRQTLEKAAGKRVTTPFKTALLAVMWTLVFAYFGLRSTPWR